MHQASGIYINTIKFKMWLWLDNYYFQFWYAGNDFPEACIVQNHAHQRWQFDFWQPNYEIPPPFKLISPWYRVQKYIVEGNITYCLYNLKNMLLKVLPLKFALDASLLII